MESIFKAVRSKVSGDKCRYREGEYDLDLTYISERILAMALPAEGVETTWRNNIDHVAQVLKQNHNRHFRVYNFSQRTYDAAKLDHQVATWCSFPDHSPPPLPLMFRILHDMHAWLCEDPKNIVVAHCLAGHGRTGTLIACYFLFVELFDNALDAVTFFGARRSHNNWGVTGPSQNRYIQYCEQIVCEKRIPSPEPLLLTSITLHGIPSFGLSGNHGCAPCFDIYNVSDPNNKVLVYSSEDEVEPKLIPVNRPGTKFTPIVPLRGDIMVQFKHKAIGKMENIFHFFFNTGMIDEKRLILTRAQLDKAYKDKRFSNAFQLSLLFEDIPDKTIFSNLLYSLGVQPMKKDEELCYFLRPRNELSYFSFSPEHLNRKLAWARDVGSCTSGDIVEKGGFLTKRGSRVKNWKRRWFVLNSHTFSYFKSPRDSSALGVIQLETIMSLASDHILVKEGTHSTLRPCIQITTFRGSLLVACTSVEDLEEWLSALEYARRVLWSSMQSGGKRFSSARVDARTYVAKVNLSILEAKYYNPASDRLKQYPTLEASHAEDTFFCRTTVREADGSVSQPHQTQSQQATLASRRAGALHQIRFDETVSLLIPSQSSRVVISFWRVPLHTKQPVYLGELSLSVQSIPSVPTSPLVDQSHRIVPMQSAASPSPLEMDSLQPGNPSATTNNSSSHSSTADRATNAASDQLRRTPLRRSNSDPQLLDAPQTMLRVRAYTQKIDRRDRNTVNSENRQMPSFAAMTLASSHEPLRQTAPSYGLVGSPRRALYQDRRTAAHSPSGVVHTANTSSASWSSASGTTTSSASVQPAATSSATVASSLPTTSSSSVSSSSATSSLSSAGEPCLSSVSSSSAALKHATSPALLSSTRSESQSASADSATLESNPHAAALRSSSDVAEVGHRPADDNCTSSANQDTTATADSAADQLPSACDRSSSAVPPSPLSPVLTRALPKPVRSSTELPRPVRGAASVDDLGLALLSGSRPDESAGSSGWTTPTLPRAHSVSAAPRPSDQMRGRRHGRTVNGTGVRISLRNPSMLPGPSTCSALFTQSNRVWLGTANGSIRVLLWKPNEQPSEEKLIKDAHQDAVLDLVMATHVWSAGAGSLCVWDVETYRKQSVLSVPGVTSMVPIAREGTSYICSGSDTGHVSIWNAETFFCRKRLRCGESGVELLAASDDRLFAGCTNGSVSVFSIKSYSLCFTVPIHTSVMRSLVFTGTGDTVWSLGSDDGFKVWESATGRVLHDVQHEVARTATSLCIMQTPAAKHHTVMLTSHQDGSFCCWSLADAQLLTTVSHKDSAPCLNARVLSHSSYVWVIGAPTGSAVLWEIS